MDEKEKEPLSGDQETPTLGLRLRKTPSFVNLVQRELSQTTTWNNNANPFGREDENHSLKFEANSSTYDFMSQPMSEKLKASNFPAIMLKIGGFERVSRHESDLVAKLYYAKRKLVWEFLEGPLKKKIEIQWSDIGAMRATIEDGQPGVWEIELNQPPLFFHETNPQPRKHTLWQPVGDFTNGQASRIRRHFVKFPRGVLDKHYEKLLQCDPRLHMLSQKPFPTQNPNVFLHQPSYEVSDLCMDFQRQAKPNPFLAFPSHMNTTQHQNNNNDNWLLQTTMLPPNNVVRVIGENNNNNNHEAQSFLPVSQPNPLVNYPSHHHEYHMNNPSMTLCNYNHPLLADHDNQVPTYNNHMVGNSVLGEPNMDPLSFYRAYLQNVSNGQAMMESSHVMTQGCLDNNNNNNNVGGTLYHGSPWLPTHQVKNGEQHLLCSNVGVPSQLFTNGGEQHSSPCSTSKSPWLPSQSQFTNGEQHDSCSTANSAVSPPPGCYPNPNQDFRNETDYQDWT